VKGQPSQARLAETVARLGVPVATGQYWALLPLAVAEGLSLYVDYRNARKQQEVAAALPASLGAALAEVDGIPENVRTSLQNTAAALVELVRREIAGLDMIDEPDADVALDVLADSSEAVAGCIAPLLDDPSKLTPHALVTTLTSELTQLLEPVLDGNAGPVAAHLSENIATAIALDDSLRGHLERAHWERTEEIRRLVGELANRLENLTDIDGPLSLLQDQVGDLLNRLRIPDRQDLFNLMERNRASIRHASFRAFRSRLCGRRPDLGRGGIEELLPEGVSLDDEVVPPRFSYLAHTLTLAERGGEEKAIQLSDLLALITDPARKRVAVLVTAPAGFGKSTFMDFLAWNLARQGHAIAAEPLRVIEKKQAGLPPPITFEGIKRNLGAALEFLADWSGEFGREAAGRLLESGAGIVLVDGLDQAEDGYRLLSGELSSRRSQPVRLVAACRQELRPDLQDGWTHILKLGSPSEEDVRKAFHPGVCAFLKEHLERWRGNRDTAPGGWRHPFFLHVLRVLQEPLAEPGPSLVSVPRLFDEYLAKLIQLGAMRRGGAGDRHRFLQSEDLIALGWLGLASLTYLWEGETGERDDDNEVTEQRFHVSVLEQARRRARAACARDPGLNPAKCDEVLREATDDAHLAYVVQPSTSGSEVVYFFHHQRLQEYLGARAIVFEVERAFGAEETEPEEEAVAKLTELVDAVVRPYRFTDRRAITRAIQGAPLLDRVRYLALWEDIVDLLVTEESVSLKDRILLTRALCRKIGDPGVSDAARSGLLRLRDELFDRDEELQAWAEENAHENLGDFKTDPVVAQFKEGVASDPFMALCWKEERRLIREQVASVADWLLKQDLEEKGIEGKVFGRLQEARETGDVKARIDALKPVLEGLLQSQEKQRVEWEVKPYGPTLAAFRPGAREPSWLLVPHGPFVAGDVKFGDEFPVRVGTVERPFWIGFDPVTAGECKPFVEGGGYANDLGGTWWQVFDRKALEGALRDRREPWRWTQQRSRLDRPVTRVSWFEAAAYCMWKNEVDGEVEGWSGPHRLPTEVEWEKASRGLLGRRWSWGCSWRPELAVHDLEWDLKNLAPAQKNRNLSPFGVRGMAGNVWEWTRTRWQGEKFGKNVKMVRVRTGDNISMRGGSFNNDWHELRCAYRRRYVAGGRSLNWGFRCFRDVI